MLSKKVILLILSIHSMYAIDRLRNHITQVPAKLAAVSEADLMQKVPGKWSRKEILGHLINSAINNLKRFADAQVTNEPYQMQGYNQDKLVLINQYHTLPLDHLLGLWKSLNTQILYLTEAIPTDTLSHPIQFGTPDAADQTLGWLIEDYVAHLEHHLKTLL